MFKIKSPIARFLAGLGTLGVIVAAVVGAFYGVGYLMEPVYARMYPGLYYDWGYRFIDHMFMGFVAFGGSFVVIVACAGVVIYARGLGNKFFK